MNLSEALECLSNVNDAEGQEYSYVHLPRDLRIISDKYDQKTAFEVASAILERQRSLLSWKPLFGIEVFRAIFDLGETPPESVIEVFLLWVQLYYPALREESEEWIILFEQGNLEEVTGKIRKALETFEFY